MHYPKHFSIALSILSLILSVEAHAADADAVTLHGLDGQIVVISSKEFAALPHKPGKLTHNGEQHLYNGVALDLLLTKIAAPSGKNLHGKDMNDVVLVTARDGYEVVFALADIDPALHPNNIILADQRDGVALPANEAPFRLIVPGDSRPSRSEREVARIDLIRIDAPAPGKAPK